MKRIAEKIILGTAQFGLEYGITNPGGMLTENTVEEILLTAHHNGVKMIDTAPAYGLAQARISTICNKNSLSFRYISKIPPCAPSELRSIALQTLEQLNTPNLDTLLLHDFQAYIQQPGLWGELLRLREENITRRIGFSLYRPTELEHILRNVFGCDVVQFPFNLFDQRFSFLIDDCQRRGIAIHARSVFLQGAFFLNPDNLPKFLQAGQRHFRQLHDYCRHHSVTISSLALSYALSHPYIEGVVLGVHSAAQLRENCMASVSAQNLNQFLEQLRQLPALDETILNPSLWKQ